MMSQTSHSSRSSSTCGAKRYKKFCKFCCDAGKSEDVFTSHYLRESTNTDANVVCPTLLAMECRYCHKAGHTVRYCPKLATPATPATDGDGWASPHAHKVHKRGKHIHPTTTPRIVFDTEIVKKSDTKPTPAPKTKTPLRSMSENRFAVLAEEDELTPMTSDFPTLGRNVPSFSKCTRSIAKLGVWSKPLTISTAPMKTNTIMKTNKTKTTKKTVTFQMSSSVPQEEQMAMMEATINHQRSQIERLREKKSVLFMDKHCPTRPLSSLSGDKTHLTAILATEELSSCEPETQTEMSWGDVDDEMSWGDICM